MKKIFTSVLFLTFAASVMAQENLVQNSTFEEWNDENGRPENWLLYDGTATRIEGTSAGTYGTSWSQTGKDNSALLQYVNGLTENTKYTVSYDYKVTNVNSDNSFRHWLRWQNADRKYLSTDSYLDDDYEDMQFGGDNSVYMENSTEWKHVSMEITTPETAVSLYLAFRCYGGSTVAIANPMMVEGSGSGLSDAQAEKTGIYSANGNVYVLSNGVGTVEVYNLLGQLVRTEQVVDGCNELSGLNAGQVYVVRYGDKAQKVVL